MTLTLNELIQAQPAITELINKDLPAVAAFRLTKLIKQISVQLETFDNTRNELIKRLGKETDEGGYQIPEDDMENRERFIAEINPLLGESVTLDYTPLSIKELNNINISPVTLLTMEMFFTE